MKWIIGAIIVLPTSLIAALVVSWVRYHRNHPSNPR